MVEKTNFRIKKFTKIKKAISRLRDEGTTGWFLCNFAIVSDKSDKSEPEKI